VTSIAGDFHVSQAYLMLRMEDIAGIADVLDRVGGIIFALYACAAGSP
jgi:hypothetical protein